MSKLTARCLLAVGLMVMNIGNTKVFAHDGHDHKAAPGAVVPNNSPPPLRSVAPRIDKLENRIPPALQFRRIPRTTLPPRDAGNVPVRGSLKDRAPAWRPNVLRRNDSWNSSPRAERSPTRSNDSTWRRTNDFSPIRPETSGLSM